MDSMRIITAVVLTLLSASLMAQEFGERVSLSKGYQDDLYTAGDTVVSTSTIEGDMVAAGGTLIIDGAIQGDALLLGGEQTLTAEIRDDLRAMGGKLVVQSKVGDDAILAGGEILLSPESTIGGNALLGGGDITMAAHVAHDLRAGGGNIIVTGHVVGSATIWADSLQIGDGAVIEGDLNYHGPREATIHPNARINGNINYIYTEFDSQRGMPSLFTLATMALSAIIFYLLFPAFSDSSSRLIGDEIGKSLGVGLAALLLVPFVAVVMMSIVVGVWIAMVLIACYLVALLVGSFVGMLYIASRVVQLLRWEPATRSRRIVAVLLAYAAVGVVQFIPVVGGLVTFTIMLLGMGGGLLLLYRGYAAGERVAM